MSKKYLFARKNQIGSISFEGIGSNDYDLKEMQRALAYQWALRNVEYHQVKEILKGEDYFDIPDDDEGRLIVVPQIIHKGKIYGPDTDSREVREKGQRKGCYQMMLNSVGILPNRLALEFITCLDCVEELYELAKAKKRLPDEDPRKKGKPSSQPASNTDEPSPQSAPNTNDPSPQPASSADESSSQPASSAETGSAEKPEPETAANSAEKPETDSASNPDSEENPTDSDDMKVAEGNVERFDRAQEGSHRSRFWGNLSNEQLTNRLRSMSYSEREELFNDLLKERDVELAEMLEWQANRKIWLTGMATFIADFNGPLSPVNKFIEESTEPETPDEDIDAVDETDSRLEPEPEPELEPEVDPEPEPKKKLAPKPQPKPQPKPAPQPAPKPQPKPEPKPTQQPKPAPEPKPEPKKSAPKPQSDEAANKEANYIRRQLKKTRKLIARAEQEGDDVSLALLADMLAALEAGNAKRYNLLKDEFEQLGAEPESESPDAPETAPAEEGISVADSAADYIEEPAVSEEPEASETPDLESDSEPDAPDTNDAYNSDDTEDADDANTSGPVDTESDDASANGPDDTEPDDAEGYTVGDVIDILELAGYDVPKVFRKMSADRPVVTDSLNRILKANGIDLEL